MRYFLISLSVFGILFTSCKKEEPIIDENEESYVIFGHFFGFCGGEECIEIFKLTDTKLLEDVDAEYPDMGFYEGDFTALSNDQFEAVEGFPQSFPADLTNETDTTFGMPDAYDQGGLYFERKTPNSHHWWIFDHDTSNVADKYHAFHQEIIDAVQTINEE